MNKKYELAYTSISQCSVAQRVPKSVLRRAKARGCPGFLSYGKVIWDQIEPWLKANPEVIENTEDEGTLLAWRTRLTKAQAIREELLVEQLKGRYLERSEVENIIKSIAQAQRNILNNSLTKELPAKLFGLSVPQINTKMVNLVNEICVAMQNLELPNAGQ